MAKLKAVDTHYSMVITSITKVHISIPFFPFNSQLGYVSHCILMTFDNHCLNLWASPLCQDAGPFAGAVYGYVQ